MRYNWSQTEELPEVPWGSGHGTSKRMNWKPNFPKSTVRRIKNQIQCVQDDKLEKNGNTIMILKEQETDK